MFCVRPSTSRGSLRCTHDPHGPALGGARPPASALTLVPTRVLPFSSVYPSTLPPPHDPPIWARALRTNSLRCTRLRSRIRTARASCAFQSALCSATISKTSTVKAVAPQIFRAPVPSSGCVLSSHLLSRSRFHARVRSAPWFTLYRWTHALPSFPPRASPARSLARSGLPS